MSQQSVGSAGALGSALEAQLAPQTLLTAIYDGQPFRAMLATSA
jgi:hypothetical protein